MLKRILIASASLCLMGGAAHAQANTSKTPDMTVIPGQLNTMPPQPRHKHRHTTPSETAPQQATTPATTKTPSPPDQNPTPPPDQIKTTPDAASPAEEPSRPMPGQEPTPQSAQSQPPPPHKR